MSRTQPAASSQRWKLILRNYKLVLRGPKLDAFNCNLRRHTQ